MKLSIKNIINKIYKRKACENIEFIGGYESFELAQNDCVGYDANNILEKTKNSLLKVKKGEAVYERDSVLFDRIEYSWPLLSNLMYVAAKNDGIINIIDFGGSLGSTYYQNIKYLKEFNVTWNIVEQEKHVQCGREHFQNDTLKFYSSIKECLKSEEQNIILLSSVLQYLSDKSTIINDIINFDFNYIIIDRMPFIQSGNNLFVKQIVPDWIYKASYPVVIYDEKNFLSEFSKKYKILEEWNCDIDRSYKISNLDEIGTYKGFILTK